MTKETTKEIPTADFSEILHAIETLESDEGVPRSVKIKMQTIKNLLQTDADLSSKLSKSLGELDELSEDINLPSFIRTHIWNISSLLEKLNR